MATITVSELLAGAHRANSAERRQQREALVDKVLEVVPVLDFDLRVARTHAWVIAQLAAKGQLIGAHDMLIAATALTHGYEILTENLNDFQRVPGLVVRQPRW